MTQRPDQTDPDLESDVSPDSEIMPDPEATPRFSLGLRSAASGLFSLGTLRVLWEAASRFQTHEGFMLSGFIAYSTLLAAFPFLIFATSLAAATIGPGEIEALIRLIFEVAPEQVAEFLQPVIEDTFSREHPQLLTFAGLGAIWISSNGVEAFRVGFDRAYAPRKQRHFLISRGVGILFVILGAAVSLLMGFLVVLAPLILQLVEHFLNRSAPFGLGFLRYLIALAAFGIFLYLMHAILPSDRPRTRRLWPGIVATIVLWTAAASAFSIYLTRFATYTVTYGGLAGVIVTLLFFYLSGAVVIYGAEINAALARRDREA